MKLNRTEKENLRQALIARQATLLQMKKDYINPEYKNKVEQDYIVVRSLIQKLCN